MKEDQSFPNNKTDISKIAIWGCIFAIIGAFLFMISGYGYQWGWWELGTAFMRFLPGGAIVSAIGMVLSIIGIIIIIRGKLSGMIYAIMGVALGIATVGSLGYWYIQASSHPPIHDITTDTQHPPRFMAIVPLRAEASNPTEYGGAEIAAIQKKNYPDIKTLYLKIPYGRAFEKALKAVRETSWTLVEKNKQQGRIEATHTLAWYGFKDDIVIRVDTVETGSKVDVRSVSRIGMGDLGVNAQRIRDYLARLK